MTTIPPSYMNYSYAPQSVQAVVPTAGNATNSAVMSQANSLQQSVVQQPLNTTTPPQLQQIQQQYVGQLQQATPTAQADPLATSDLSTTAGINAMVANASRAADVLIAQQAQAQQIQAVAPAVAPQVVSPAQQVQPASTPVAQTVNTQGILTQQQQQLATVQPTTASTSTNANPQSQSQQMAPTIGSSDGQGNILWRNPQGQLQWMPEAQVLAMYQAGKETGGSVQLPDGTWAKKTTVESVIEKLKTRATAQELLANGTITADQFKTLGGTQDLSKVLNQSVADRNQKARERMKAAVGEGASATSLDQLGGASPYSSFSPSAGGGSETG